MSLVAQERLPYNLNSIIVSINSYQLNQLNSTILITLKRPNKSFVRTRLMDFGKNADNVRRIIATRVSKIPLAVTTSLRRFLADYFFRSEKKSPLPDIWQ